MLYFLNFLKNKKKVHFLCVNGPPEANVNGENSVSRFVFRPLGVGKISRVTLILKYTKFYVEVKMLFNFFIRGS